MAADVLVRCESGGRRVRAGDTVRLRVGDVALLVSGGAVPVEPDPVWHAVVVGEPYAPVAALSVFGSLLLAGLLFWLARRARRRAGPRL